MRNLKRALSLAMASVMTLGMMTVGASAKGLADFSDAAEITNADAVAVTSAVGIFKGYEDGEFKGENVVTRAEMAVICAKLLRGADVDPAQFTGISKFTDTPAWAEGYINLCASLGIIAGRGDGIFDPSATVSTVEAASMLTKTLGYFQNQKDYGSDWKLAVTAKAAQLGLYGDLKLAADTGLTRDNVAELVFNTMTKAVPVDYNELLGVYYNKNQGIVYALEFNYLETLGYKNFDLVYTTEENTVYGRPATTWGTGSYKYNTGATSDATTGDHLTAEGGLITDNVRMLDKDAIVTVAKEADYVFTTNTSSADIYKALGKDVVDCEDWTVFVNGKEVAEDDIVKPEKDNKKDYTYTAKGAVLEVYIDDYANDGDGAVTLCEINYYLGEVSNVKSDDDGAYVNVKELSDIKLDDKKYYTDELEKGDLVVFTVDYNDDEDYYIPEMMTPATVTGEVTRVEKDKDSKDTYIRLDGESTKYYYASAEHNVYDLNDTTEEHPELKEDYILYMTPAGYVLGFELAEETETKYLYVKDSDEELKDWVAKVVLADASTAKVEVKNEYKAIGLKDPVKIDWTDYSIDGVDKITDLDSRIWKYSVSDKGVYSLTEVVTEGTFIDEDNNEIIDEDHVDYVTYEINKGKAYVNEEQDDTTDFIVDEDTIFVDTMNDKVYVGYSAVPNVSNAELAYTLKDGVAEIVYILGGDIYDADSTYFVLTKDSHDTLKYDGEYYREYFNAYVNGEKTTLNIAYDALYADEQGLEAGVLYKALKTIDEEYITEVEIVNIDADFVGTLDAIGNNAFKLVTSDKNIVKFDTDADTQFVVVEAIYDKFNVFDKWSVTDADIKDLKDIKDEAEQYAVAVVEETKQNAELVYVFVNKEFGVPLMTAVLDKDSKITDVKVAGAEDGLVLNETLVLLITGTPDGFAKADPDLTKFLAGQVYSVVVNGQVCLGVGKNSNTLKVLYNVQGNDLNGKLELNMGDVILETKMAAKAEKLAESIDEIITENEINVDEPLTAGTVQAGKADVNTIQVTLTAAKADKGYDLYYTTNNDTVTIGVEFIDEVEVMENGKWYDITVDIVADKDDEDAMKALWTVEIVDKIAGVDADVDAEGLSKEIALSKDGKATFGTISVKLDWVEDETAAQ